MGGGPDVVRRKPREAGPKVVRGAGYKLSALALLGVLAATHASSCGGSVSDSGGSSPPEASGVPSSEVVKQSSLTAPRLVAGDVFFGASFKGKKI